MPTRGKKGERSLGRSGARWEACRREVFRRSKICAFQGNKKWPACGQLIDMDLPYPHPMSKTVDHRIPVSELAWDDPRLYDPNLCDPFHKVCNERKGTGKSNKKAKHPTSRNWRK